MENSPNFSCHFWKRKSVFLQILDQYSVLSNITLLYFFRSNIIYFGQRQSIKVQIFEIFECLGQNLLNSSCQFWTNQFLFKFCIFLHCHCLHFDVLLFSRTYKVSAKKVQKDFLMTLTKDPNFEEKLTFCLKNNMRNLVNLDPSSGKSENLYFDGLLL